MGESNWIRVTKKDKVKRGWLEKRGKEEKYEKNKDKEYKEKGEEE